MTTAIGSWAPRGARRSIGSRSRSTTGRGRGHGAPVGDLLDLQRQPSRGKQARKFAWRFWTLDWGTPAAGEHTVTSRAFDVDGNVQPPPEDPFLASKVTFWESNGQITRRVRIP